MNLEETIEQHRDQLIRRLIQVFDWEPEDAEDILQDAWIKLARQEPPASGNWVPYLLQTVKTLSMDREKVEGNRIKLHEKKWGKIAKGFNLLETDPVYDVPNTGLEEDYFIDSDEIESSGA